MVCDRMLDTYGPVAPALLLAQALKAKDYQVTLVSTKISSEVQGLLRSSSLDFVDLDVHLLTGNRPGFSWLETWSREAFLKLNSRGFDPRSCLVINFSHTLAVPSAVWYAQGPTTDAIRDMQAELPIAYQLLYKAVKPILELGDRRLIRRMASCSRLIVANSKFCASLYEARNLEVGGIIYPPLDCTTFIPTSTPRSDYVLTYMGKETDFTALKNIGDAGMKVRIFGSKSPLKPRQVLAHPNIEFLGKVSTHELVDLYSNALFTLFTFTHEPFGYIPVESLACGTPVLTYNSQGPSETVIDGVTGWLANTREEIQRLALRLWKSGYSSAMRTAARERALSFEREKIAGEWMQMIERLLGN